VRRGGRIVSVAVIIAIGVNADGRREVLGMEVGTSEAEPILFAALNSERYGARRVTRERLEPAPLSLRHRRRETPTSFTGTFMVRGSLAYLNRSLKAKGEPKVQK
jgi:hypothetical protein